MIACGIDFGTSNSVCSITDGDKVSLVPLENNKNIIPSSIFFFKDGAVAFGRAAMEAYVEGDEGRLMRGLKSILGTSLMLERTVIYGKSVDFSEILKIYFNHLKVQIEKFANQSVDTVVLGRPVHFHDNDINADNLSQETLKKIAADVGFKNISFQYEPVAAAYAHEVRSKKEKIAIVADFGGGTSDFTVIRLAGQNQQDVINKDAVLSTEGVRTGGNNFDKLLSMRSFMPSLGYGSSYRDMFDPVKILPIPNNAYVDLSDWPRVSLAQTSKVILQTKKLIPYAREPQKLKNLLSIQEGGLGYLFLQTVEDTKISLSSFDKVSKIFNEGGLSLDFQIIREDFEQSLEYEMTKIYNAIINCLQKASVSNKDVDTVLLTGGSSQLPVIQRMISNIFPQAELSNLDKFSSVGLGLGFIAKSNFDLEF